MIMRVFRTEMITESYFRCTTLPCVGQEVLLAATWYGHDLSNENVRKRSMWELLQADHELRLPDQSVVSNFKLKPC